VVKVPGEVPEETSLELCGGTHVGRTGEIGGFRIITEESIAAGTRRVEAVTGEGLEALLDARLDLLKQSAERLKVPEEDLPRGIGQLVDQLKEQRRQLKKYRSADAAQSANEIVSKARSLDNGLVFFSGRVDGVSVEELRKMSDTLRSRADGPAGLVLLSVEDGKVHIVAAFDDAFQKQGIRAGDVCRNLGKALGGGGGGKPGMAQGQGKDPARADEALEQTVAELLEKLRT
jgi:alanyl-tRNA synthetase